MDKSVHFYSSESVFIKYNLIRLWLILFILLNLTLLANNYFGKRTVSTGLDFLFQSIYPSREVLYQTELRLKGVFLSCLVHLSKIKETECISNDLLIWLRELRGFIHMWLFLWFWHLFFALAWSFILGFSFTRGSNFALDNPSSRDLIIGKVIPKVQVCATTI